MAAHKKYPDELRERAVRMVFEIRERDGKGHGEIAQVVPCAATRLTGSPHHWGNCSSTSARTAPADTLS
jgi:hypothetical protein